MKHLLASFLLVTAAGGADLQWLDNYTVNPSGTVGETIRAATTKININMSNLLSGNLPLTNPPVRGGLTVDGTLTSTSGVFTTLSGEGSAITGIPVLVTNSGTIYVSPLGNDTTARSGRADKPWLTLSVAVTNLVDGGTMILLPGTHTIEAKMSSTNSDNTFSLSNKSNVRIIGVGATIYSDDYGDILTLWSCTNVEVSGIRFLGSNALVPVSGGANAAVVYFCGTNAGHNIHHNTFQKPANQGVSGYIRAFLQRDIRVSNNHFEQVGTPNAFVVQGWADGAAVSGIGPGWIIENNTIINSFRGVELQSGQTADLISNVVIRGNTIISNSDKAIYCESVYSDVNISGNHIISNTTTNTLANPFAISILRGTNFYIANNLIKGVRNIASTAVSVGIYVQRAHGVTIVGNDISDVGYADANSPGAGILVQGMTGYKSSAINITGNSIHDSQSTWSQGIATYGSDAIGWDISGVKIQDNSIWNMSSGAFLASPDTFLYSGISLRAGSNILVSGNSVYDTVWPKTSKTCLAGLYIAPAVSNIVIGLNDFSGTKLIEITNAASTGAYSYMSPFVNSDGNVIIDALYVTNLVILTNALSAWPVVPEERGASYIGNSNGAIFILTSWPASATWTKTNLLVTP